MYSYNTGLIRPPVPEADVVRNLQGSLIKGVSEPESSSSHDLQVAYRNDQLLAKVTLYRTKFSNKIESIPRQTLSDGVKVGRVNGENLYMEGIEIEYQWDVTEGLLAYGNYSNASTEYSDNLVSFDIQTFDLLEISNIISPDKSATGYPKHILNMGFDWKISDGYHLNFHYRHWRGAQAKWSNSPASFKDFSGNNYLNINLIIENMAVEGLKINVFAKNLFDNTDPYPNAVKGGYSEMYGIKYGIGLEYSFDL
jgi:outer membrane receptor for ferrienterochelin and colicin